jgi:pimeloyl-ACP methyl ester carboxylesterase
VLATRPYLDPKRVGIWGWSGGGSMTLNALLRHPDLYTAGISIASVPNMRLYDTIYQERYMGLPSDNAEGYRQGSPLTRRTRQNTAELCPAPHHQGHQRLGSPGMSRDGGNLLLQRFRDRFCSGCSSEFWHLSVPDGRGQERRPTLQCESWDHRASLDAVR